MVIADRDYIPVLSHVVNFATRKNTIKSKTNTYFFVCSSRTAMSNSVGYSLVCGMNRVMWTHKRPFFSDAILDSVFFTFFRL